MKEYKDYSDMGLENVLAGLGRSSRLIRRVGAK